MDRRRWNHPPPSKHRVIQKWTKLFNLAVKVYSKSTDTALTQPVMDLIMDSSLGHQDTADALTAGARKGPFPWKVSRFTVGRIRRGQTHQDMVVIWRTENPGRPNLKRWTAS